jgi:hypothetical protein
MSLDMRAPRVVVIGIEAQEAGPTSAWNGPLLP